MSLKSLIARFGPQDALLKTFMKGSFWAVFGNVVVKGSSLIASVFIARFLGSGSFGELSMIKTTLSVFSLFATFGLGVTVTKFVAECRKSNLSDLGKIISAANVITFTTGASLGLLIVAFSSVISNDILNSSNLTLPLRISGAFLFFNAMTVYQVGVLSGLEAFKELARINSIVGIITLPVLLITTYLFDLNGTLLGLTINQGINWALNRIAIAKRIKGEGVALDYKNLSTSIKVLLKFSYPLALKEIIYSISNWACFYLLLLKTNYNEVGIFNSANQLSQLILFLPASILTVFLSMLSGQVNDRKNYAQLVRKNILFTLFVSIVVGMGLLIVSPIIYQFYGVTYVGGEKILYVLTAATIPMSLIGVFEQVCISSSKPGLVTIFQFIIQFLILTSAFILFAVFDSAIALALAFLAGYILAATAMYYYLRVWGYLK